ncbi:MAG TPA: hypothetical protein VKZ63_20255 [Kofleriaceae bacterium]|nr:hypothetical protein [Kofleriaceae bacterium]
MTHHVPRGSHRRGLAVLVAAIATAPAAARAAEDGGTVSGTVTLADPSKRDRWPERSEGFVPRARNALKPPRAFDPLPYIVVVLEGGTPAPEDTEAPGQPVRYTIIGEAFEQPILPVVVGSIVEVKNGGARSPRLYVAGEDGLIPGDPVSPKAERKTRPIAEPNRAYVIRDRESAHLTGRVVAFPHRYFARVGPGGKFEIEGVAPGTWRVRVWYEDGWVDMPSQTIEVEARREARVKQIALPARLTTTPAN